MRNTVRILLPVLAVIGLAGVGCRRTPARVTEVVAVSATTVPLAPGDPLWDRAPEHAAKLLLQDLVEPRLTKPSTTEVRVRAVAVGDRIAFRMEWLDATANDLPGSGRFVDSCAVQVLKTIEANVPAPQMGEKGKPIEITFWRADWQAAVNGRGDTIRDIYPGASVDHYPFEAQSLPPGSDAQKEMALRYAPARSLGNRRSGPREVPVEDMVAEGPGTITPGEVTTSRGNGVRTKDGWAVVINRRLPNGLTPRQRTQVAFAVWEGGVQEVGARKMRTGWIPLSMQEAK